MAFIREVKQELTNSVEDLTKLTKLKMQNVQEQMQNEVTQQNMEHIEEDLKTDYVQLKETIKNAIK
ncbi:MAG: hypothetical protein ACRCSG_07510 [Cellulosilyticaceae bacterium]